MKWVILTRHFLFFLSTRKRVFLQHDFYDCTTIDTTMERCEFNVQSYRRRLTTARFFHDYGWAIGHLSALCLSFDLSSPRPVVSLFVSLGLRCLRAFAGGLPSRFAIMIWFSEHRLEYIWFESILLATSCVTVCDFELLLLVCCNSDFRTMHSWPSSFLSAYLTPFPDSSLLLLHENFLR
jgi:hypothetical protein